MTDFLYLHGFASSPQSGKAQDLRSRFQSLGIPLHIPDLNQNDFFHLTLSRQIQQGVDWIQGRAANSDHPPAVLIGSSLGGLTAAWIAQRPEVQGRITQLVLLAPAFQFLAQWLPRLGSEPVTQWQQAGELQVYHYGVGKPLPLAYGFITDAQRYDDAQLTAPIPTLILHGRRDEVIRIDASRDYAAARPWVRLVELESDHALLDQSEAIWQEMRSFLNL